MIRRKRIKDSDEIKVTFVQPLNEERGRIFVARSNGTASAALTLNSGDRYAFRYVTADGDWFNDEQADDYEPNGIDGFNCVLRT